MRKKVALFSAFYPYRGGIAQFSANLYRAIEKEGVEPFAYTFSRQYPDFLFPGKTQLTESGDNPDPIPAARILDSLNPFTFKKAGKVILNSGTDLVISQYWMTFFGPSIGAMHKYLGSKGVKRISILHNVIPHEKRFFDNRANRYFLKQNDGFVVMSDVVLADLLLFQPKAKYLRIDHPAYSHFGERLERNNALDKLGLSSENKYLLFFGFIRKYKGLDILIEALNDLPEDIHLIIAGESYDKMDFYTDLIQKLGLNERVHLFNDYIPDEDVKIYFSASDACVLPYRSATQSGITAIAHHFCVPVIVSDVGGLKEVVTDNVDGYVVSSADAHLIGNAVKELYRDDNLQRFREELLRSRENKSWDHFANELLKFADTL